MLETTLQQIVLLSLQVAAVAALATVPPGIFTGWLLARRHFRGKMLFDTLINLPLVLPPVVTGYFLLVVFGREGVLGKWLHQVTGIALSFTWQAAALAAAVVSFPLFVRAVRVAIENIDPRLEEAASVLRAGAWSTFRRITLPLAANGIIAGLLITFARSLGEFGATIMVAGNIPGKTQTIPLAIFSLVNRPGGERTALLLIAISILLSYGSLLASEWLLRRWPQAGMAGAKIAADPTTSPSPH